ncbi:hypothetical protein H310_05789 [Aphanomyces invadans]|uniref:RING-type domain-containing protein n=1 Tax=Aphanomyces invadans TaxID=157072 RepID=A0A024U7M6_9STRA|nr:hypothetical protein H310_05789 [Aphanomyces invadans]ETW02230.1 hypothetical protein H310_05789 [Aphanomyces invadans]|eukprot:XP_008868835.1 hypothetical protein H310_05789 [Aphanomyces invadans]
MGSIREDVVAPMEGVAVDDIYAVELDGLNLLNDIELHSILDPLGGQEDESLVEERIDDRAGRPPSVPHHRQQRVSRVATQETPVIDLTSDDMDDDAPVIVATLYPNPTLSATAKRHMCKKRKLPMQGHRSHGNGRPARHVRYDPEHIRSAECTQVCLDNQVALEMYRKATTCAICLDTLRDLTSTSCGHIFCRECITQAVFASQKCPMCQTPNEPHDIHPLYL